MASSATAARSREAGIYHSFSWPSHVSCKDLRPQGKEGGAPGKEGATLDERGGWGRESD